MKKTIISLILILTISLSSKAQVTTIDLSLDTPCVSLSINNYEIQNDFIIHPNPSNGIINIKGNYNKIENIKIYDLKGALIFKSNLSENKEISKHKILNVDYLQNGIYFLSFKAKNKITTKKLIINKQ